MRDRSILANQLRLALTVNQPFAAHYSFVWLASANGDNVGCDRRIAKVVERPVRAGREILHTHLLKAERLKMEQLSIF